MSESKRKTRPTVGPSVRAVPPSGQTKKRTDSMDASSRFSFFLYSLSLSFSLALNESLPICFFALCFLSLSITFDLSCACTSTPLSHFVPLTVYRLLSPEFRKLTALSPATKHWLRSERNREQAKDYLNALLSELNKSTIVAEFRDPCVFLCTLSLSLSLSLVWIFSVGNCIRVP